MTVQEQVTRTVAGRYRLSRELGSGGMGRVWQAHDEALGRNVALKELRPPEGMDSEDEEGLRSRFRNEARTAARLQHPRIVTVHDIVDDHGLWIVMQLVDGRSLHDAIRADGPLPLGDVARIGIALTDALDAAHKEGVVHRDVTPRNVLLGSDGTVVLGDFGIAAAADQARLTQDGHIVGTPGFMAPERLHGHPATAASDLWSLGATLYEATEATRPFHATGPGALVTSILSGKITPPARAAALGPLLAGLLATNPEQRPWAAAVRRYLTDINSPTGDGPTGTGPVAAAPTTVPQPIGPDDLTEMERPEAEPAAAGTLGADGPPTGRHEGRAEGTGAEATSIHAPPPRYVFRPSPGIGLALLSLLVLTLGIGALWIAFSRETMPFGILLLGLAGAGIGTRAVVGLLAGLRDRERATTLTIDHRGMDCRPGTSVSGGHREPRVPWHLVLDATVVDSTLLLTLDGPGADRLPQGRKDRSVPGAYALCSRQEFGSLGRSRRLAQEINAAVDAHVGYRRQLGLLRIVLTDAGPDRAAVIGAIEELLGVTRKVADHLARSTPTPVLQRVTPPEAGSARRTLEAAGAKVEVVRLGSPAT